MQAGLQGTASGRVLRLRPALTIVEEIAPRIDEGARGEIRRLAARLRANEPTLGSLAAFGPDVAPGVGPGPAVFMEDQSAQAMGDRTIASALEYRCMFLAAEGDFVIVAGQRHVEFEAYCRDVVSLRDLTVIRPAVPADKPLPLATRCAQDVALLSTLSSAARRHGGLTFIPYMGSGNAWMLAAAVAAESRVKIRVCAPPPRLTRRVNDKLWFARRVQELVGRESLPATRSAFGPAALAGQVGMLARRHERIFVKVPNASGSEGNIVLNSRELLELPAADLRRRLIELLGGLGWQNQWPLATGVWDCAVLDSPSVQLWIPQADDGPPIVEGVFSQTVSDTAGEFVGAAPSVLPPVTRHRLAEEAVVIACLLQELGYYGRCSFDAVLDGEDPVTARIHWLECNGRWGGVSIPLTIANRLAGHGRRRPFVVVQRTGLSGPPHGSFGELLRLLQGRLYDEATAAPGLILLSPWRTVAGNGLHFMVLADSVDAAKRAAAAASRLLLRTGRPASAFPGDE